MQKIYLASTSPRRKILLKQVGLKFKTISSDYQEDMTLKMSPIKLAQHLSRGKANSAAKKIKSGIIISADTFVSFEGKIIGKPNNKNQAKKMLEEISGKTIKVITGFTVLDIKNKKEVSKSIVTKVFIKKLSDKEIDNYIKTGEPLDKAGAFAIQGIGSLFIKKIEGDYNNAMGLPLYELSLVLNKFGISIL